jgi:hypothetical protein
MWFNSANVPKLLLPVTITAVVVLMLGVGVNMVQQRQQTQVAADAGITAFSVTNIGEGRALVAFKSLRKNVVFEYSLSDKNEWQVVTPVFSYGVYTVRLENLEKGEWYKVRISGATFEFQAE